MELVLPRAPRLPSAPNVPRATAHCASAHCVKSCDDGALLARARSGEVGALDELMNRHRGRIVNLTFQITRDRDLAEDCAQEAFVRAFSKLHLFRAQSSFGTWLYRIALNVALEKTRAPALETEALDAEQSAPPHHPDQKMALEWALDRLSPPLRVALILREWHGLSYQEMASVCEVPVGTVRSRLSAARAEFRRLWAQMEAE